MSNPFASDRNIFANIAKGVGKTTLNKQKDQTNNNAKETGYKLSSDANLNNNFAKNPYASKNELKDPYQNDRNTYSYSYNKTNQLIGNNNAKLGNQSQKTGFYQQKITFGEGNRQQQYSNLKKYDFDKKKDYVLTSQDQFEPKSKFQGNNLQYQKYANGLESQIYKHGYVKQQALIGQKNDPIYQKNTQKLDKVNYGVNSNYNGYKTQNYDYSRNNANQIDSKVQAYSYKGYGQASNQESRNLMFSPINQASKHRLEESQFLNIDAMSEDLSKLLASSQNQLQLCKILGIDRNQLVRNHNQNAIPNQHIIQNQPVKSFSNPNNNLKKDNWVNPSQSSEHEIAYNKKPQAKVVKINEKQANLSVFHRGTFGQPPVKVYDAQEFENMDNRETMHFNRKPQYSQNYQKEEHLPTFVLKNNDLKSTNFDRAKPNYQNKVDQQPQIVQYSRQPKQLHKYENIKFKNVNSQMEKIPQVFNYSNLVIENQLSDSYNLQKTIKQQMSRICTNGRIRTFLTANQKIQAAVYKFQPL